MKGEISLEALCLENTVFVKPQFRENLISVRIHLPDLIFVSGLYIVSQGSPMISVNCGVPENV